MKGILGKKSGMTQVFDDTGVAVAVTVIEAGPCYVTQVKTEESDGYNAIQLGFEETREKSLTQPELGHLDDLPPLRYLREIRVDDAEEYEVGQIIAADVFEPGELVDVSGISKGRGFAGGMKRHGFGGGPATHGQSDRQRAPGSIGQTSTPGRVYKGKRMAGRMGNERVTIQNLEVIRVDPERNMIAVKGSIPGGPNGLVIVRQATK